MIITCSSGGSDSRFSSCFWLYQILNPAVLFGSFPELTTIFILVVTYSFYALQVSTIVGVEYIPKCKILSLAVVFCLVFVYNKLIDLFPKHQLFYIVGG